MFKKIIAVLLVTLVVAGGAVNASAVCQNENERPEIIGTELIDDFMKINALYESGVVEITYKVEMTCADGHWIVILTGDGEHEGYTAVGLYDHFPSKEEMDILWANRMLNDEIDVLMEKYGF